MKNIILSLVLAAFSISSHAQNADSTLDIVNWNIEWFGSNTNGPADKELQKQNVVKILRYLNADIYALTEIVDVEKLRQVVDSLGDGYAFTISDFCSFASDTTDPDWSSGQKLAVVYKTSIFSNVRTRAVLRNSTTAYNNFASGRLPYLFTAKAQLNGASRKINLFVIHAKSGATPNDFSRRLGGVYELKDSLDKYYSRGTNILLGDYNDDLDRTIVAGTDVKVSPYNKIVKDSTDSNYYRSITLPLSYAGEASTIGFSDVIDHQIISDELDSMYLKGSAKIRKDIVSVVPDYATRNTSDHYPVSSRYNLVSGDTSMIDTYVVDISTPPAGTPPVTPGTGITFNGFKLWPNPFQKNISFKTGTAFNNVEMSLFNTIGQKVWSSKLAQLPSQATKTQEVPELSSGIYLLHFSSNEKSAWFKLLRL